jgi:hypothetical protein
MTFKKRPHRAGKVAFQCEFGCVGGSCAESARLHERKNRGECGALQHGMSLMASDRHSTSILETDQLQKKRAKRDMCKSVFERSPARPLTVAVAFKRFQP